MATILRRRLSAPSPGDRSLAALDFRNSAIGRAYKTQGKSHSSLLIGLGVLFILAPWIHVFRVQSRASALLKDLSDLQDKQSGLESEMKRTAERLSKSKEVVEQLDSENRKMLKELQDHGDNIDTDNRLYNQAGELENALVARIDQLRSSIRARNERRLRQKYGDGPYRVNVTLTERFGPGRKNYLIIETAPLSLAPHAIDHFLRTAVEMKLWDGMTFMLHRLVGPTVIQTSPIIAETGEWSTARLDDAELTQLAFTEHSFRFPIEMYSVAFAGQPGGPEFFINMDHRSRTDQQINEGEACFGKVVEGRDVVDDIVEKYRKKNNAATTGIVSIRLIPTEE